MISTTTFRKSNLKVWISLVIFLLTSFHAYSQQLSGPYTISPSGDYTTFSAAATALNTKGVSGPVIFNVANGTYTEQVRIGTIPGASALNTVTIQSQSSDSSKVVLTYSSVASASNWTLKLDSTDNVTIREFVTINRGTKANYETVIGNNCLLMAYVHIAHDCIIGNNCILANAANLGGHITIDDWAIVGGLSAIHQFVNIGAHAMISGGSLVRKDVPPYTKAAREPLSYVGINSIGLSVFK